MFEYFDTHSHLYFPDYDTDREEQIAQMKKNKIGAVSVGVDFESSLKSIELSEKNENIFASVGQHPGEITASSEFDEKIFDLAENQKVVAIGECGLDYYKISSDDVFQKITQKKIFEKQIDLSLKIKKPLILHIRPSSGTMDAYEDALEILEHRVRGKGEKIKGNAHFFAGNIQILERFLSIGFFVSFTGVVSFTRDYDESVKYAPLNKIMPETDAPFVSPIPHRGGRNSSLYIPLIVKKIAEIRHEPLEEVQKTLLQNSLDFFGLQNQ